MRVFRREALCKHDIWVSVFIFLCRRYDWSACVRFAMTIYSQTAKIYNIYTFCSREAFVPVRTSVRASVPTALYDEAWLHLAMRNATSCAMTALEEVGSVCVRTTARVL